VARASRVKAVFCNARGRGVTCSVDPGRAAADVEELCRRYFERIPRATS